jgi:5'-3' exonuclease
MKTALIIDGNYLLHKDVFILHGMKTLHKDLQDLMRMDVQKLMKMYPWDDIYFVSDSKVGYWRKQEFRGYKSDRKPDTNIDWSWVYEEYASLRLFIREHTTIRQLQVDWAEGDDIIAYIVNRNNEMGYSNFIIAADSDLHQLLRFDLSKEYINIVHNYKFSDERIYVPENYNVYFSEMKRSAVNTLFDMNQDDEFLSFVEDIINKTKTIEVSYEELLFTKLIGGDKKDSVPSVHLKETKTGKMMGIGRDGAKSIYNLYKETYDEPIDFDSNDFVKKAAEMVSFVKKVTDDDKIDIIKENIKRNRKLLMLTEKYLPVKLLERFDMKINVGKKIVPKSPPIDDFFLS